MKLLLFCANLVFVFAQTTSKDPNKDFCRRYLHQTCVVDSKLYIDGGLVYYDEYANFWDSSTKLIQSKFGSKEVCSRK
jgi:hypothetical protein